MLSTKGDSPAESGETPVDARNAIDFRHPNPTDGAKVHQLVADCPPLDHNSLYCNLLQCSHFSDSAVLAECDGEPVGFISGYRLPARPEVLFVWQVMVAPAARGRGLGDRMLAWLFGQLKRRGVSAVEATVTESNRASLRMFTRFAEAQGLALSRDPCFDRDLHLAGKHASEYLLRMA